MKLLRQIAAASLLAASSLTHAANVLVVFSDSDTLDLKNGRTFSTGFYLNEAMQPIKLLLDAGHKITIATPTGRVPTLDKGSINPMFFGGDANALGEHQTLLNQLAFTSLQNSPVISLTRVAQLGYDNFDAVLIPGGHAPMQDLLTDKNLGKLLTAFHEKQKPTALICHGPIALISTLDNANTFADTMAKNKQATTGKKWIYAGYKMTVFSNAEEEASKGQLKGGEMKFYPENALKIAGGDMQVKEPWQNNLVEDRELITAQNPMSATSLGEKLVAILAKK